MARVRKITIGEDGNIQSDTGFKDDGNMGNWDNFVEIYDWTGKQRKRQRIPFGANDGVLEAGSKTALTMSMPEIMRDVKANADAKTAAKNAATTKAENIEKVTKDTGYDALSSILARIQEREADIGGDIATRRGMAESDIERMRAEAYGGKYGYDTNKDGMISDDERTMEIDPRMSTMGRTELNQRRSDNSRGLLSSTLSQGDTARGNNALNRALGQFQGETMNKVNDYEMGQRETLRGMNDEFDRDRALIGQQAGVRYELEDYDYTDPTTNTVSKRKRIKALT